MSIDGKLAYFELEYENIHSNTIIIDFYDNYPWISMILFIPNYSRFGLMRFIFELWSTSLFHIHCNIMLSSITPNFISNLKICIVVINDSIYPLLLPIFPKLVSKWMSEGLHLFTSLEWILYLLPITCNIKGSHLSQILYDFSYPELLRLRLTITPNKKAIRIREFHHDHKQLFDYYWLNDQ